MSKNEAGKLDCPSVAFHMLDSDSLAKHRSPLLKLDDLGLASLMAYLFEFELFLCTDMFSRAYAVSSHSFYRKLGLACFSRLPKFERRFDSELPQQALLFNPAWSGFIVLMEFDLAPCDMSRDVWDKGCSSTPALCVCETMVRRGQE
eukprot:Gb_31622 [translate_table: standard]